LKKGILILFIICARHLYGGHATKNSNTPLYTITCNTEKPNPIWISFKKKNNAHKKVIASVLAFPLPFGVIGLHRIYLGTKPYVPLIYIGTFGGGFGILPFIDFFVLLLDKDIEHYKSNPHIFMWIENQNKKTEIEQNNNYDGK
jgi:TM2 domain-containing membrane protein YozV